MFYLYSLTMLLLLSCAILVFCILTDLKKKEVMQLPDPQLGVIHFSQFYSIALHVHAALFVL